MHKIGTWKYGTRHENKRTYQAEGMCRSFHYPYSVCSKGFRVQARSALSIQGDSQDSKIRAEQIEIVGEEEQAVWKNHQTSKTPHCGKRVRCQAFRQQSQTRTMSMCEKGFEITALTPEVEEHKKQA